MVVLVVMALVMMLSLMMLAVFCLVVLVVVLVLMLARSLGVLCIAWHVGVQTGVGVSVSSGGVGQPAPYRKPSSQRGQARAVQTVYPAA